MLLPNYYTAVYSNLALLPEPVQKQALDYINFLVFKYYTAENLQNTQTEIVSEFREFGVFKGKIRMSADFNEPMDDFNEY